MESTSVLKSIYGWPAAVVMFFGLSVVGVYFYLFDSTAGVSSGKKRGAVNRLFSRETDRG